MKLEFSFKNLAYSFDSDTYYDLSMPIKNGNDNPNAYYIDEPKIEPFCAGGFVGSVKDGGACNCENITFNAHGNGTHTEGIGHITKERIAIYNVLNNTLLKTILVSIEPINVQSDWVISKALIENLDLDQMDAIVLRTLPNSDDKKAKKYSGSNPVFLLAETTAYLAELGIQHLLLDLPSVDKEEDEGALLAHRAFWNYPDNPRMNATITEMIYAGNEVLDGFYLMNLQIASFDSDASPSRPLLYPLNQK